MLLKLIIVDDEKIIRESLPIIVDWLSLGYEVVGVFSDGKEAIDYIERKPVDVVLSDIKMTFVSGLELAEYIYTHKPEIKVVILSGHKDFEFARHAMKYSVDHYLLKPTKLKELTSTFHQIKEQIEKEAEKKELVTLQNQQIEDLLPLLQEQFFVDLTMGVIKNTSEIEKKMELLGLKIDSDHIKCCLLDLQLLNFKQYTDNSWFYGKDSLYNALRKFIENKENSISYYMFNYRKEKMQVIAIGASHMEDIAFQNTIKAYFEKVKEYINSVLGLEILYEIRSIYSNIFDMVNESNPAFSLDHYGDSHCNIEDLIKTNDVFLEQQKLFMTYINSSNFEAAYHLFCSFIRSMENVNMNTIHNYVIDLIALLKDRLNNIGIDFLLIYNDAFSYSDIMKLKTIQEIEAWGSRILKTITNYIKNHNDFSEKHVIQKAKDFIKNNCCNDLSLDDVGDHVFLSSVYLSRLFKQQTGENFIDYLIKERMEMAKTLLQNQEYKVYEISLMISYKSVKYFNRLFKKYTGLTPTEYRNNFFNEGETIGQA